MKLRPLIGLFGSPRTSLSVFGRSVLRPTIPLLTALVAIMVLFRSLTDIVAAPVIASIEPIDDFQMASTAKSAKEPEFFGLDPFEHIEPAAGPVSSSDAESQASRPNSKPFEMTTVEGLEDVARDLVQRREAIEMREAEIELLEQALLANRQDVEREITRLEKLRDDITALVAQADEQEEQRLQQLVKVYETMKAKKAAAIFDQLELPVLMPVAKRMRETKLASVMAAMNPGKAKLVTRELARELNLPELN